MANITTTEIINGHSYLVTRNENGDIISTVGNEPWVTIPTKIYSKYGFRKLFTLTERIAMDSFETSTLTSEQKAMMRTLKTDFQVADEINLDDPLLGIGVNAMESFGLLGVGRAAEILAGIKPS